MLQINEISLDGVTNEKAMESLRHALTESVKKGYIRIVIARKAKPDVNDPVPNGKPGLSLSPLDQIGKFHSLRFIINLDINSQSIYIFVP